MNHLMRKLLARVYMGEENGGEGGGGGGGGSNDAGAASDKPAPVSGVSADEWGAIAVGEDDEFGSAGGDPAAGGAGNDGQAAGAGDEPSDEKGAGEDAAAEDDTIEIPAEVLSDEQSGEISKEEADKLLADYRTSLEARYQLTEDQQTELLSDPNKVFPAMAAELHISVMREVTGMIQRQMAALQEQVPEQLEATRAREKNEQAARDLFFSVNEDLREVPEEILMRAGAYYSHMNPIKPGDKISPKKRAKEIGNLIRAFMGKGVASESDESHSSGVKPPKPVVGQGRTASPAGKQPENVWAELAKDDD